MDIVDRLLRDRPIFHARGTERWDASASTLRAIQQAVREGDHSLEIGCGASTVVFAAQSARHTVISLDGEEHDRVRGYLKQIGIDDNQLVFIVGWSDQFLPRLSPEAASLDVAFIDGAHGSPYPAVDWHYVSRALKVGGKLLLDDIPIPAVSCVFRFMQADPHWRLDAILENRTAVFSLINEPMIEQGDLTDWTKQPFKRPLGFWFRSAAAPGAPDSVIGGREVPRNGQPPVSRIKARLEVSIRDCDRLRPQIGSRWLPLRPISSLVQRPSYIEALWIAARIAVGNSVCTAQEAISIEPDPRLVLWLHVVGNQRETRREPAVPAANLIICFVSRNPDCPIRC